MLHCQSFVNILLVLDEFITSSLLFFNVKWFYTTLYNTCVRSWQFFSTFLCHLRDFMKIFPILEWKNKENWHVCFRREENRNFWAKYSYAFICISLSFLNCETNTVKPLKTDIPRDKQKCPSYRGNFQ